MQFVDEPLMNDINKYGNSLTNITEGFDLFVKNSLAD